MIALPFGVYGAIYDDLTIDIGIDLRSDLSKLVGLGARGVVRLTCARVIAHDRTGIHVHVIVR